MLTVYRLTVKVYKMSNMFVKLTIHIHCYSYGYINAIKQPLQYTHMTTEDIRHLTEPEQAPH